MKIKTCISILLFLVCFQVRAENIDIYGLRPFLSITNNFADRWGINLFAAETFNLSDSQQSGYNYPARDIQSYTQLSLIYKYSPNWNFSFGYVFQKNNPYSDDFSVENRFLQQILYSHSFFQGNLAHRIRFEERFIQGRGRAVDPMATRLRYQVSFTAAFNGLSIVANSWFYSLYNEFYFSSSGKRNSLYSENWTFAGVGYQSRSFGSFSFGPLLQIATINSSKDTRSFLVAQLGWSLTF